LWKVILLSKWDEIIGSLKDKVIIDKIHKGVLVLGVAHPAWAQELLMLSPLLLQKINACLEKQYITAIRFKFIDVAALKSYKQNQTIFFKSEAGQPKNVTLSGREECVIEGIKDQDLQQALKGFLVVCKKGLQEEKK
jgi:hypothetical protein